MKYLLVVSLMFMFGCASMFPREEPKQKDSDLTDCARACNAKRSKLKVYEDDKIKCECEK